MSQRVDVYLDVDDVINPVFDPASGVAAVLSGWRDWRPEPSRVRGLLAYSPAMIERLRALSELPHVEVHWCTTWGERAATELAPAVGLSDFNVIDRDRAFMRNEGSTPTAWWKRDAVQAHHAERPEHRLVWVDDDLGFDEKARLWLRSVRSLAMGVTPDTSVGLTRREMERIEAFVMA